MSSAFSGDFDLPNFPMAACKDAAIPPDSWFPNMSSSRKGLAEARKICKTCPVMVQCREWAIEMYEDFGLWGNTTPRQRRRIRKERLANVTVSLVELEITHDTP